MIIDFAARLVVNGTPAPEMPRLGNVLSCDEQTTLDMWLPYRIPEQWQMTTETRRWGELANRRRRPQFAELDPCDDRAVLYAKLAEKPCGSCAGDPRRHGVVGGRDPRLVASDAA